ncbi:MAG: sulfatase-like hydrolase/transferase, partial [Verrucomicrobia bacterium]|nr:sulfatase-like hydrolase/transferase [Verrucomicrobiota bacterium]
HFGKWHIGTLSKKHSNFRRGDDLSAVYAPPWERDFDESLVSESNLATWDPYDYTGLLEKKHHDIFYRNGKPVSSGMEGAVSRILVDHALLFIEQAVKEKKPFMSTIWFHAPHHPVRAGPKYLEMYKDLKEGQRHYYGCITALDEQVGRLRAELERLGVAENTLIFFCADNGPEGDGHPGEEHDLYLGSSYGQTGGLRGRKRWTYNGGVCVPAFAYWPGTIKGEQTIETPACTADYLSTLCALTGYNLPNNLPQDGEDIMPYLTGNRLSRYKAIGFSSIQGKGPPFSIIKDNYRLFTNLAENAGESDELYRLDDMAEETNIAAEHPELVARMKVELRAWYESCRNSYENGDYEGHVMMGEFPYIETVNAEKGK